MTAKLHNLVAKYMNKTIDIEDCNGIPVEGQIWDIERLFRVCCSEQGRQVIEIDFTE